MQCRYLVQDSLGRRKYMSNLRCRLFLAHVWFIKTLLHVGRNHFYCGCKRLECCLGMSQPPFANFDPHAPPCGTVSGNQIRYSLYARRSRPLLSPGSKTVCGRKIIRSQIDGFFDLPRSGSVVRLVRRICRDGTQDLPPDWVHLQSLGSKRRWASFRFLWGLPTGVLRGLLAGGLES